MGLFGINKTVAYSEKKFVNLIKKGKSVEANKILRSLAADSLLLVTDIMVSPEFIEGLSNALAGSQITKINLSNFHVSSQAGKNAFINLLKQNPNIVEITLGVGIGEFQGLASLASEMNYQIAQNRFQAIPIQAIAEKEQAYDEKNAKLSRLSATLDEESIADVKNKHQCLEKFNLELSEKKPKNLKNTIKLWEKIYQTDAPEFVRLHLQGVVETAKRNRTPFHQCLITRNETRLKSMRERGVPIITVNAEKAIATIAEETKIFVEEIVKQAAIHSKHNNNELAIDFYRRAIRRDPRHESAHHSLGYIYLQKSELDNAIILLSKAISIRREEKKVEDKQADGVLYTRRAQAYEQSGRYKEAMADFDKAISITPTLGILYVGRARIYSKMENFSMAVVNYYKAMDIDPNISRDEMNGLEWKALLLRRLGNANFKSNAIKLTVDIKVLDSVYHKDLEVYDKQFELAETYFANKIVIARRRLDSHHTKWQRNRATVEEYFTSFEKKLSKQLASAKSTEARYQEYISSTKKDLAKTNEGLRETHNAIGILRQNEQHSQANKILKINKSLSSKHRKQTENLHDAERKYQAFKVEEWGEYNEKMAFFQGEKKLFSQKNSEANKEKIKLEKDLKQAEHNWEARSQYIKAKKAGIYIGKASDSLNSAEYGRAIVECSYANIIDGSHFTQAFTSAFKGYAYHYLADSIRSVDCLTNAVNLLPNVASFRFALGVVYMEIGNYKDARKLLSSAATISRDDFGSAAEVKEVDDKILEIVIDLLRKANTCYSFGHFREALTVLNEAVGWLPGNNLPVSELYCARGKAYEGIKDFRKAYQDYKTVGSERNIVSMIETIAELAAAERNSKDYNSAINYYDLLIELFPSRADFMVERGKTYEKMKHFSAAYKNYEQANSQTSINQMVETILNLADAELSQINAQGYRTCLGYYNLLIELFPGRNEFYTRRGLLNELHNNLALAYCDYRYEPAKRQIVVQKIVALELPTYQATIFAQYQIFEAITTQWQAVKTKTRHQNLVNKSLVVLKEGGEKVATSYSISDDGRFLPSADLVAYREAVDRADDAIYTHIITDKERFRAEEGALPKFNSSIQKIVSEVGATPKVWLQEQLPTRTFFSRRANWERTVKDSTIAVEKIIGLKK